MTTVDATEEDTYAQVKVYALERDRDVSGISGIGRVAYAIEMSAGVLLVWDTEWATIDWRPDMTVLEAIHGHDGATRIVPVGRDSQERRHAMELAAQVWVPAAMAFSELGGLLHAERFL